MNKYFRKALSIVVASAMMVSSAPGLVLAEETPKTETATEAEAKKNESSVQTETKQAETKEAEAPKQETAAPETSAQKSEAPAKEETAAPKTEETAAQESAPKTDSGAQAETSAQSETPAQTPAASAAKPARAPRKAPEDQAPVTITEIKWYDNGAVTAFDKATYDGNAHNIAAKGTDADGKEVDLKVNDASEASVTDAGEYTFTASAPDDDYILDSGLTNTASLSIAKQDITGLTINPASREKEYDGTAADLPAVTRADGVVDQDKDKLSTFFTPSIKNEKNESVSEAKDAGTYTVSYALSEAAAKNYTLSAADTATITVKPRTIEDITIDEDLTYNGNVQDLPAVTDAVNIVEADKAAANDLFASELAQGEEFKDAGTYEITYTLQNGVTNYVLKSGTVKKTVTIKPAAITDYKIAADGQTVRYTGKDQASTLLKVTEITGIQGQDQAENVLAVDSVKLGDSKQIELKNAGTYQIAYQLNDTNYSFDAAKTKSVTVLPAQADIHFTWKDNKGKALPVSTEGKATAKYQKNKEYHLEAAFTGLDGNGPVTVTDELEGDQTDCSLPGTYSAVLSNETFKQNHPNYELKTDTVTSPELAIGQGVISDVTWYYQGKTVLPASAEWDGHSYKDDFSIVAKDAGGSEVPVTLTWSADPLEPGTYTVTASIDNADAPYYVFDGSVATEKNFEIVMQGVTVTWTEPDFTYNGQKQVPEVKVTRTNGGTDIPAAAYEIQVTDAEGKAAESVNAADYTAKVVLKDTDHYVIDQGKDALQYTIAPKKVKASDLTWANTSQTYAGTVLWPTATFKGVDDAEYSVDKFVETDGNVTRNAGSYKVSPAADTTFTKKGSDPAVQNKNYVIEGDDASTEFTITQAEAAVVWTGIQTYYYDSNAHRPTAAFEGLGDDKGSHELDVSVDGSKDLSPVHVKAGKDGAAAYDAVASFKDADALFAQNYKLTGEKQSYTILPRGVTITPKDGQKRYYGQADPGIYKKTFTFTVYPEDGQNQLDEGALTGQLQAMQAGTDVIKYVDDDPNAAAPGDYTFVLNLNDGAENRADFDVTIAPDVTYTVNKFDISIATNEINSRTDSFKVVMDSLNDLKKGQTADPDLYSRIRPVVSLSFADDTKGIRYDQNLVAGYYGTDTFYSNLSDQLGSKITTPDVAYSVKGYKDSWPGKLPAGTKVTVRYFDRNGVAVSEKTSFTVTKKKVSLSIEPSGAVTGTDAASGVIYLKKGATIKVTGSNGEVASVTYNDAVVREGDSIFDYLVKIAAEDNGNSHATQNVAAAFLDVLNLDFTEQKLAFVYDDKAFDVTTIEFSNRDKKIHIVLPETGTLNSVTIAGAKVSLKKAGRGKEFDLDVKWSGKALIKTGTAITVEYTDQAGNVGKGSSTAKRSTVSTPITLKIRPDLNPNGFLNGMGDGYLIVSGTACGDEPIRVTVAGSSQETYATGKEVWSDSTGTWEVRFSMSQLPEGGNFTITAEYVDVNGKPASMTAKYNAYVCKPAGLSPLFDMMPFMSGMVEPGTDVTLVIGDQNYEMNVDEFGHFLLNDLDLLAPGDIFYVKVSDIAGNVNIMQFTVPEGDDLGRITAPLQPIGKFFYDGGKDASSVYDATPLRMADLQKGDQEIPLLYGLTYKVGKMTLQKTDEGFTISNELDPDIFADPDTYEESDQTLFVYDHQPTLEELRNHAGTEYKPGDEIKAADDAVVWIQYEENLKMMPDSLTSDLIYNFEYLDEEQRKKEPDKYDEYKAYDAYQRFDGKASESEAQA